MPSQLKVVITVLSQLLIKTGFFFAFLWYESHYFNIPRKQFPFHSILQFFLFGYPSAEDFYQKKELNQEKFKSGAAPWQLC